MTTKYPVIRTRVDTRSELFATNTEANTRAVEELQGALAKAGCVAIEQQPFGRQVHPAFSRPG